MHKEISEMYSGMPEKYIGFLKPKESKIDENKFDEDIIVEKNIVYTTEKVPYFTSLQNDFITKYNNADVLYIIDDSMK